MASPGPQRPPPRSRSNGSGSNISLPIPEGRPIPYTVKCTPEEYIKGITYHSRQTSADTVYPGEIYDTLSRFLAGSEYQTSCDNFAWLVSPGQPGHPLSPDVQSLSDWQTMSDGSRNRERSQHEGFANPEQCIEGLRKNIELSQPQVLFLRGHPSPHWLASIGAFCYADPELFRWFLRYRERPGDDYYFDAAPSAMSSIFRFKFFTIGSKNYSLRSSQKAVDSMRAKAANDLEKYRTALRGSWNLRQGDSIVRDLYVLDERHCVIEQEVVVSTFEIGRTWMAIACTDAGRDLFTHGPQLPWLRGDTETRPAELLPIVQYRPKCALKARSISERAPAPTQKRNTQSLAVFPEGYGRSLDWSLAKSDRMYALLEIFRLAAFSQKQLLNVLQQKIVTETRSLSANIEHPTMANLLYFRDILQDQLGYVSNLSRLTDDQTRVSHSVQRPATVDHGMAEVHRLFEDLRSQAQSLHERCTQGMTVISNNSMLEESQRAIKQAELVTKLTKVAFVYLPFTFTAGFFGMNFKELGTGEIHLWIYFVASLPLMFVTMAFYVLDEQRVKGIRQALQISDPDGAKQQQ